MRSISPDTIIGHYRVVSQIGEGGMGEVYLTEDSRLHRKVALKILPSEMAVNQKDPNYALAYSDIAYTYNFASDWYLAPHDAMPKAKAAALKALELDNALASGHSVLGSVAFWYEWDWATCELEVLRSIELDPTISHREYGNYLTAMGRLDEAIREGETAQRNAPLDLMSYGDLTKTRHLNGSTNRSRRVGC